MIRYRGDEVQDAIDYVNAARSRSLSSQETVTRDAQDLRLKVASVLFGLDVNRPLEDYLRKRGTDCLFYFSTDTNALSVWNGMAWVTTTLS